MKQTFTIPHRLTTLNEYINAERSNKYKAAKIKKQETQTAFIFTGKLKPMKSPIKVTCYWHYKNKNRDLDNVAYAKKYIMDSLQQRGTIKNDNSSNIIEYHDIFVHDSEEKVIVEMEEVK